MSATKLKNAPLKEVVFELHWEGRMESSGAQIDEGFDLAQGIFAELLRADYPIHKKLIPDGAPIKLFGGPLHQYWRGESEWPVVQHGQGILAVNDVEAGYEWQNKYKPIVTGAIDRLRKSYQEPPKLKRAKLQYIDAVDIDGTPALEFMRANLLTQIVTKYNAPGKIKNFGVFQSFILDDGSELQLNISNGINNKDKKPSLIWTTTVEKKYAFKFEEIEEWLDNAHTTTSKMFKDMLAPDFYARLDR